jgi:two-component system sensor histidine kinase DegS
VIKLLLPQHRKEDYIMYDNNGNKENLEENSIYDKKAASILLKDLVIEFDEKLYTIKVQLKYQMNLLKEKELELTEKERTKVHNLDLFSPIYSKSHDTKEIYIVIEQLKQKIEELNLEQKSLIDKIAGLKVAAHLIDNMEIGPVNHETNKHSESKQKQNDKGLSILEAQEFERQRIARELHDSTVQNLTSLVHKSELCIKLIDIDSIRAKLELTAMSNTIKTVINEMRGVIYNLKPMTLDDLGLTITVERYANRLMDLYNMHVIVHSNNETKEILPVIKLTLFRIIQEACVNVIKHANASLITIDIKYEEHDITVLIRDNGIGFESDKLPTQVSEQSSSFGLSIMKERISLLSGAVDIQSEKGMGTIVTVSAPLTTFEGDKNE